MIVRPRSLSLLVAVAVVVVGGCEPPPPPDPLPDNEAPVARLLGPQIARVGTAARFDASSSDDIDGVVVAWSFVFSDGTPQVVDDDDGVFDHVFDAPGRVVVRTEVEDDAGDIVGTEIDIVVIVGDIEACDCDALCLDDGVCAASGCVVRSTSADETLPVIDDALDCG